MLTPQSDRETNFSLHQDSAGSAGSSAGWETLKPLGIRREYYNLVVFSIYILQTITLESYKNVNYSTQLEN